MSRSGKEIAGDYESRERISEVAGKLIRLAHQTANAGIKIPDFGSYYSSFLESKLDIDGSVGGIVLYESKTSKEGLVSHIILDKYERPIGNITWEVYGVLTSVKNGGIIRIDSGNLPYDIIAPWEPFCDSEKPLKQLEVNIVMKLFPASWESNSAV